MAKRRAENTPSREHVALRWRRTKIVATLGPASAAPEVLERLVTVGVDVIRLNMSHGDHASHRESVRLIRATAARHGKHIAILMDLCGPKIRVGRFADGGIELREGATVTVSTAAVTGRDGLIPSQYKTLAKDVAKGERILLDDGKLELSVLAVSGNEVRCRVVHGGRLTDNKGMNLPDSKLSTPALTDKDKRDAQLAVELDVDFLALSFVRAAADVLQLQRFLARHKAEIPIISKIERPEAVAAIEEILRVSYGIMVARGDLGIELPAERVPLIQRDLIERARRDAVPVIVATQMLESTLTAARPTRAEVGDVAGAALTSADAVMLSAETASGKFPVEAVQTMDRILREIERHQWHSGCFVSDVAVAGDGRIYSDREAVAHAAVDLAHDLKLAALIIPTMTGTTARIMAAYRATAPLIGVCASDAISRRLSLHWGVIPVQVRESDTHDWRHLCELVAPRVGLTGKGHQVLVLAGFSDEPGHNEPVMKMLRL
ncbi:MAG: pyruvate kinase [Gammaproteobacteria bacterium]|nr:pyruvate kinase [Gammaproteobacteria bacterium]